MVTVIYGTEHHFMVAKQFLVFQEPYKTGVLHFGEQSAIPDHTEFSKYLLVYSQFAQCAVMFIVSRRLYKKILNNYVNIRSILALIV